MREPGCNIDCVAFPDDGAEKRFGYLFKAEFPGLELVTCAKKRDINDPAARSVVVKDGSAKGRHVVIVDDMIQSGGTLYECGKMLMATEGALSVCAFCTHGIFPNESWRKFLKGGARAIFKRIFITNTNPTVVSQLPLSAGDNSDSPFEVLDLTSLVLTDL